MKYSQKLKTLVLTFLSTITLSSSLFAEEYLGNVIINNLPKGIGEVYRRMEENFINVSNPDYLFPFPEQNYNQRNINYEFKSLVTFGDSLSDRGAQTRSTMFLAGGYDKKLYNDFLSLHYTGKFSVPFTRDGVNYGEAGASLKQVEENRRYTDDQVNMYLERFNGRADPNNIYVLWAGSMDINSQLASIILSQLKGDYSFNDPLFTPGDSPDYARSQTQRLLDAGANYIFVANIPDASFAPFLSILPIDLVISNVLNTLMIPTWGLILNQGTIADNFLRNKNNQIPGSGREFIRMNGANAMKQVLWFLPSFAVENMYYYLSDLTHYTTVQFNNSLELALQNVNGSVVFMDISGLLNEMIEDPKTYGFDELLVPVCTIGFSSRYCDIGSKHFHDDQVYFFGDWFHPSQEGHQAIMQYMMSVFDAPVYVSSIARQLNDINSARRDFTLNKLNNLRQTEPEIQKWTPFIGYSGSVNQNKSYIESKTTYTNNLNVGLYHFINEHFVLGAMITLGSGSNKPHNNYHYNFDNQILTLFGQWNSNNHYWINTNAYIGNLEVKNIKRQIPIRIHTVEETGSTKAKAYGIEFKGGYDIIKRENLNTGPFAAISANRFNVDGYRENDMRSTSMHFDDYHVNRNIASVGWYANFINREIKGKPSNYSVEVSYNSAIGDSKTKITSAINKTKTSFTREVSRPSGKQWVDIKGGINIQAAKDLNIFSNLGVTLDKYDNHKLNYSVGAKYQF